MDCKQYGPEDGPDLVCVLGWGNQHHHQNVEWLLDQFVEEGYRVHAFEIPVVITEFEREYVAPVDRYVEELGEYRLVGHSAGGLVAAYLDGARTTTFLSPFWGFPEGQVGVDDALLDLASLVPLAKPVLPSGTASREAIGGLATERELREGPSKAAPTFIREARQAHRDLPPIADDAVVFCTLADPIVSTRAIGEAVPAERTIVYDGGHELFASRSRAEHLETLLAVVDRGASALDG
jgi:pimeloyl-ACP methyl ester carboxylesterase